ncbi:MAG: DUF2497 domain-containing protein [Pseudomonadota bacterium]
MAQNNEASVEEILESIKKVIARDNRENADQARRRRQADADEAAERAASERMAAASDKNDEILDLGEMEIAPDDARDGVEATDAPLIGEDVRGAMQENLAALAMLAEPGAKPQIVRSGETSLEGLTRELLRPMLAEWLDKNLPGMVEEMVQAEISRIAGKRS